MERLVAMRDRFLILPADVRRDAERDLELFERHRDYVDMRAMAHRLFGPGLPWDGPELQLVLTRVINNALTYTPQPMRDVHHAGGAGPGGRAARSEPGAGASAGAGAGASADIGDDMDLET